MKKDQVVIKLIKENNNSWATELAESGLDVFESEESEEN